MISPQAQTALTYVRGALFNPVSLSVMAFAVCVGVGYAGMLGALIAMATFVALGASATRYQYVRHQLDKQFEYRVKQKREADRMKLLKPTGPVRQQQYCELRDLVGEIERTDAREAQPLRAAGPARSFRPLAVSHQKCLESLRLAGSSDLPRALPLPDPHRSKRRREIHGSAASATATSACAASSASPTRSRPWTSWSGWSRSASRARCSSGDLDREIERRLWELDEVDAALQLPS